MTRKPRQFEGRFSQAVLDFLGWVLSLVTLWLCGRAYRRALAHARAGRTEAVGRYVLPRW